MSEAISIADLSYLFTSPVANMLLAACITALVSWFFYKKSGDALIRETRMLKEQNQLTLACLEQANLVELVRKDNEIIGIKNWKIRIQGIDGMTVSAPSVGHCKPGNTNEFK